MIGLRSNARLLHRYAVLSEVAVTRNPDPVQRLSEGVQKTKKLATVRDYAFSRNCFDQTKADMESQARPSSRRKQTQWSCQYTSVADEEQPIASLCEVAW
jgi:hypothetical protein